LLSQLGVNIGPLLAAAGVLGVAVGFGSQKLVQDVITGFFILLEDAFAVGDVIQVGSYSGAVEAVSIRNVRLRDLAGTVHTIPFSTITSVSNLTRDFSFHVFDMGIAYRENVDQVMETLRAIGSEMRSDTYFRNLILDEPEVFGLDSFGDSAVVIKGRIKTRPIKQWEVGREFNRRVKKRFDELGIEIPFPHRTLYFGVDKDGKAPPAHLVTELLQQTSPEAGRVEKAVTAGGAGESA
jgi:moderate conductance mechanosensitive channel